MARKKMMAATGKSCASCASCGKTLAWVVLIVGVLLLLQDLGYLVLWGISPWTVVFVLVGLKMVKKSSCSSCGVC